MRKKRQLGLWLNLATCEVITELARGQHINAFIEELVEQEAARRKGEVVDTKTLPALREMIQYEFLRVIAALHLKLSKEMQRQNQENTTAIISEMS